MGGLSLLGDFAARNLADTRLVELLKKVLASVFYGRFRGLYDRMNQSPVYRENARVDVTLSANKTSEDGTLIALVKCAHFTNAPLGERKFLASPQRYPLDFYARGAFTDYWTVAPAPGVSAEDPETFAVLDYALDGQSYPVRRTVINDEQIYRAKPGKLKASSPDGLYYEEYTYRVRVPREGATLHFTVDVPTRGYTVEITHFNTGINRLSLLDFFASDTEPRINASTGQPGPASVAVDGWVMPTSGVVINWVLNCAPVHG